MGGAAHGRAVTSRGDESPRSHWAPWVCPSEVNAVCFDERDHNVPQIPATLRPWKAQTHRLPDPPVEFPSLPSQERLR